METIVSASLKNHYPPGYLLASSMSIANRVLIHNKTMCCYHNEEETNRGFLS